MRKFFIIVFLFLYLALVAQEDYRILSSNTNSLVVEYTPVFSDLYKININNNEYTEIHLLNGVESGEFIVGSPQVLSRILSIGVPSEFGNTLSVLSSDYRTINGKIKPFPNAGKKNDLPYYDYSENENYKSFFADLVTFGDYGKVRDLKTQQVIINPIQYDQLKEEIKLYSRIVFQISFANAGNQNRLLKSDLTKNFVINEKVVKNWGENFSSLNKKLIQNSVLATGDWYRFEVSEEGIFKINRSFLSNVGIDVNSIDPRTIKIYNNGGYNLSWNLEAEKPIDLVENAIFVSGEADGSFDENDEIIFYGRTVDFWEFDNISDKISRNKHFYSKKNYYWLTFGGTEGKRMGTVVSEDGNSSITETTTPAFRFQDENNRNLINSGLLFIEDDYSSSSKTKTYTHMLDGLVNGTSIDYSFQFVNGSKRQNSLSIEENGSVIFSRLISGPSVYLSEYKYGAISYYRTSYSGSLPDNRSILKFTFTPSTIEDKGHLDFLEIQYTQNMNAPISGIPLIFFSPMIDSVVKYSGTPFSNSNFKIYDITDFSNVKIINNNYNAGEFSFNKRASRIFSYKYMAIHDSDVKVPQNPEKVNNSNLRGFETGAQYVIITHNEFMEQALRLENYRKNEAPFKTTTFIADIDQIYNEFSGGLLDPTAIRNFLKYAYDNWSIKPEYVLLFGDGDFDYFNVLEKDVNFIPTFQTTESMFEIDSYSYDDFYARVSGNDKLADLSIGRLCATNQEEAKIIVDKIIYYETDPNKGLWRNKITLLADDGLAGEGKNDGNLHTSQSENLSTVYIPENFDRNKIYLSSYETVNTGLGRRKPDVNKIVIDAINNGTLILNYVGHGNPNVWTHERVFERSLSIPQLTNKELFFLTAATCDFGKYDNPNEFNGLNEMIFLENAGMIGGVGAIRPVFAGQNHSLNQSFYRYLFTETDSIGFPNPIGKAFHRLKQVKTGRNDEKFHLFADPFLRLNIPKLPVEITSVNESNSGDTVNIKALSDVSISGKVLNIGGTDSQFEGEGIISVFDSERSVRLDDINYNMIVQGGVIFRGRVKVEDGQFSTSFTVPKDISYENKNGKIIAYFFNDELDGVGYSNNIIVGGTDSTKTNDGKGPEIEILYDDETESSYLVSPNFKLRVKLSDQTGLNTTGTGIGHKLEAILNDDTQNSIDLTNYFVGDINSGGKSGEINYNFSGLEPGEYKIKINAWDVYNNFASQEDYFTVVDGNDLVIREVYNYPNPFSSNTYFTFQHNLSDALNVKIKIYTIAGRVIKEIESFNLEDKFVKIEWDGRDDDNDEIGNGTYLYKLIVESVNGEYKENILGKMAVIK